MKKVKYILASAILALSSTANAESLKVHTFLPSTDLHLKAFKEFIEETPSIKYDIFPSSQLGGSALDFVYQPKDKISDVVFGVTSYSQSVFPKLSVLELPGVLTKNDLEVNICVIDKFIASHSDTGWSDLVKPIAVFDHPEYRLYTNKKVENLEDLKGLKIRVPSTISSKVFDKLEAEPIGMPISAALEALASGVVDGVILNRSIAHVLKINELAPYELTFRDNISKTILFWGIGYEQYNDLTDVSKNEFDQAATLLKKHEANIQFVYDDELVREEYSLSEEDNNKVKEKLDEVAMEWVKNQNDFDGLALYNDAKEFMKSCQ